MENQLYELLRLCTVRVSIPDKTGYGTGFFVAPGLILTCAHVVKAAQPDTTSVEIYWNGQSHPAIITLSLPAIDLALLQISLTGHPCVYLHEEAVPFDDLYSYGYPDTHPGGDPATFSLEGKAGEQGEQLKFKLGQVRPGLSGAPLLNVRTGHVCGVVQLTRDRNNDLGGRAIPTTTVFQAFPELLTQQQQFHRDDRRWLNCLWEFIARTKYLEGIIRRYSSVTLPIGPAEGFSLQAIFQPLALRHDPLEAELRERMRMQTLLGESVQSAEAAVHQPVVAENGEDALKRTPKGRIVVLGGPGTGKTTTLKYFTEGRARKALDDMTASIPLFISLPFLARSGKLRLYVEDLVEDMGVDSRYAYILWREIEAGNAFICMDGLDEVEPKHRPRMIELINSRATSAGNIWVIGSRFTEYKGGQFKQAQFAEWELLPMNHALRMELAQRLLPELQRLLPLAWRSTPLSAASFVSVLEQHPQASAWGDNPLLFSLAAAVFWQTHGLPSSRVTLYRNIIGAVIETREQDSVQHKLLLRQLSQFAFWLHLSKGRTFSSDDLLAFYIDVVHKPEEEAASLSHRIVSSGMLDVMGRETYSFRHQSFQEYLTASELARRLTSQNPNVREDAWNFAWSKRTYSRWTEVLRLMIGVLVQLGPTGKSQAMRWLQSLATQRKSEDGDPGSLGLMLALSCLVEVAVLPEWLNSQTSGLGEQIVSISIEEVLAHAPRSRGHIPKQLETVARELSFLRGTLADMVVKRCLTFLQGPDEGTRRVAVEILKKQGERVPVAPLLSALKSEQADIREAALLILTEQGENVPLEPLLRALLDDDWSVRDAAAQALARQGERVPLEPLLQILQDKRSPNLYGLGKVFKVFGERLPLEPFLDCLLDDDSDVTVIARDVLIDQGMRVPVDAWIEVIRRAGWLNHIQVSFTLAAQKERLPVDALLDILQDENEVARWVAAELLRDREPPAPVEKLLPALKHKDPRVRLIILEALGKQWQRVPEDPLWDALDDTNSMIVGAAITAMGNRLSQKILSSMLESEFEAIRIGALKALAAHGLDANVELALAALHDRSTSVCRQAVDTLSTLVAVGVQVPFDWLLTASNNTDHMMLGAVEKALEVMGERVPLEILFEALQGNGWINYSAAKVLSSLGERIPVQTLFDMAQYDYAGIRCAAVYILGAQGKRGSVELLLASLRDKHPSVREAAVEVLGGQKRLPDKSLVVALRDENTNVCHTAARVLQALGKDAPLEAVIAALDDADKEICLIAATICTTHEMPVPTEVLIRALQNARDVLIFERGALEIALVEALAVKEDQNALDMLLRILQQHSEDAVRHAAAQAVRRRLEPLSLDELMQMFYSLYTGDAPQRRAAVELLGVYGEEGGVPVPLEVLKDIIDEDDDEEVSGAALQALLVQGRRVPMYIYRDLLQSGNTYLRDIALKALAKQGSRLPLSDLLDALRSDDRLMYDTVGQVLEMQGTLLPIEIMLEALQHDYEKIRQAVVRILIAQKRYVPVQSLLALLQDEQRRMRTAVVEVLTAYREPIPIELLLKELYDPEFTIGEEKFRIIAQAIIAQGERVPLGSLLPGLYNRNRRVRQAILEVLQGLKKPVPLEMLMSAVVDEDMNVVSLAAQMLHDQYANILKQITVEAAAILQGQSQGSFLSSITQCFIASIIKQLGYPAPEFLAKLTDLLRWPHWLVRLNAIEALGKLRRNVPDEAIKRLLQLRRDPDPMMSAICQAADEALAEILSLETGIEDD